MAYYTGAATSTSNLLETIKLALEAEGWVINHFGADTGFSGGTDANIALTKTTATNMLAVTSVAGQHFMFLAYDSNYRIAVSSHTSAYSSGSNRDSQVGMPWISGKAWAITNGLTGPFTAYYLFIGDSYCHVVVERTTNNFSHFHVGALDRAGNYTGGEYLTGTAWTYGSTSYQHQPDSPYNSTPFDSYYNYNSGDMQYVRYNSTWYRMGTYHAASTEAKGFVRADSVCHFLFARTPNTMNAVTVLIPSMVYGPAPGQSGLVQIYGTVKDLRSVNIAYLAPKQVITIGSDEWMVFPIIRKGYTANTESCSGNYGLAYRKVL